MPGLSALIVAIAERGDRAAFATLFSHFAPRVKSYMLSLGASAEVAEELAQDTMLIVWRRAGAFDPTKAAASTWIFTIARNLRIDAARRDRRPIPGGDPSMEATGAVLREAFFSNRPHSEIATNLDLPLGTVKSRLRLAMARLRTLLGESS